MLHKMGYSACPDCCEEDGVNRNCVYCAGNFITKDEVSTRHVFYDGSDEKFKGCYGQIMAEHETRYTVEVKRDGRRGVPGFCLLPKDDCKILFNCEACDGNGLLNGCMDDPCEHCSSEGIDVDRNYEEYGFEL